MRTKDEILVDNVENLGMAQGNIILATEALKAMGEWGEQCFIAGIEAAVHHYKDTRINGNYPFVIKDKFNNYLKKLDTLNS